MNSYWTYQELFTAARTTHICTQLQGLPNNVHCFWRYPSIYTFFWTTELFTLQPCKLFLSYVTTYKVARTNQIHTQLMALQSYVHCYWYYPAIYTVVWATKLPVITLHRTALTPRKLEVLIFDYGERNIFCIVDTTNHPTGYHWRTSKPWRSCRLLLYGYHV